MSDYRAIAEVSRSLRTLLQDRLQDMVDVTIAPPDITLPAMDGRRLNLYLYQVTEHTALKNQDIPGNGHPAAYGLPPLSLELHYLVTAYGSSEDNDDVDLDAQQILGDAMRVLHDHAIVTEELAITRPAVGQVGDPILAPGLHGACEQVKITLHPGTLEDFSKLWTSLPQANFRRSVLYQVSVVQIESQRLRRLALPVRTRRVHVSTVRRPEITTVYRTPVQPTDPLGDLRVALLQQLTIEGLHLQARRTWVRLGGLEPIRVAPPTDTRLQIAVPDNMYPIDADHPVTRPIPVAQQLQPGPQAVEVLTEHDGEAVQGGLEHGTVATSLRTFTSNRTVFMVVPTITSIAPANGTTADILTVHGTRLYRDGLPSIVLVGDVAIVVRAPEPGDPWGVPTATTVQVPLTALATAMPPPPPGGQDYPVRMQVHGAQTIDEGMLFRLMP